MRKMLVVVVMLAIVPALAKAATVTCTPGNYTGKIWSVSTDLNGKPGTLTVTKEGEKCVMNFKAEGASEAWEFFGNTLVQKEFDKTGKLMDQYSATLQGDKYIINCKDRAKNDCDAGIDYRNYWVVKTTPTDVVYTVYGVGTEKKADTAAPAIKRHEFSFKKLETPATSN